jgi:MFS family permease
MSQTNPQNGTTSATPATLDLRSRVAPANDTGAGPVAVRTGLLGLPRAYWTLWGGMLLNRMGGAVFFLLSLYLTRERGLRPELAGLVISLYAAGGLFGAPLGGALSDRLGRRAALLTGTAGAGTLMLALGLARATSAIVAIAPLLGFFSALPQPALQAAVADLVPPHDRKRAYGLLYWAVNLGFAGAAALGGALAERHFGLLFVVDALTTFAYGAIVLVALPETRPALSPDAAAGARRAGLLAPLRDRPFVSFVLVQTLLLVAFAQVIVGLPLDMRAHGVALPHIGWLMALNGVYIVFLQPLALRLVRGHSHTRWLVVGTALTGLGLGATAFAGSALAYALTSLVWTLGEVGFSTASPTIVAELAPADRRGAYQGTYQLSWGVASLIAPVVGTLVLARLGSAALWAGCLVVCLAAAALHQRLARRRGAATASIESKTES